jgi:hypothetical protein
MKQKSVAIYIAIVVVFGLVGLTRFSENVRTVQVAGLFASGMAAGVGLAGIIGTLRNKRGAHID